VRCGHSGRLRSISEGHGFSPRRTGGKVRVSRGVARPLGVRPRDGWLRKCASGPSDATLGLALSDYWSRHHSLSQPKLRPAVASAHRSMPSVAQYLGPNCRGPQSSVFVSCRVRRFWGLYVHVRKMETLRKAYALAKDNDAGQAAGNTARTLEHHSRSVSDAASNLRALPPQWLVGALNQFIPDLLEERLYALRFDGREGNPIYSGGTSWPPPLTASPTSSPPACAHTRSASTVVNLIKQDHIRVVFALAWHAFR
jgi:hypothetical protein